MPELAACMAATCPSAAATILTDEITRILDIMAPVRTIQNRKNFAPYLSTDTKTLQSAAKTAQEIAANSGRPGGPPTQLYHLGSHISSPSGLATTMNKFFLDKVKKLRDGIPETQTDPLAKI